MKRENLSAGQHSQIGIWRLARGGEEKRFHFEPISISKKKNFNLSQSNWKILTVVVMAKPEHVRVKVRVRIWLFLGSLNDNYLLSRISCAR